MAAGVKTFGELFSETWADYKRRWLTILGVILLGSLLVVGLITLFGVGAALLIGGFQTLIQQFEAGHPSSLPNGLMTALFLLTMVLGLWSQSAVVAVTVNEELGVMGAMAEGWRRLWSMAWILGLAAGVVITGLLPTLLILFLCIFLWGGYSLLAMGVFAELSQHILDNPWIMGANAGVVIVGILLMSIGIFFAISLMFSVYPLYEGRNIRGMDALMYSRRLVRGRWWNTTGKILLILLMASVLQLVPLVGSILYLVFSPFLMLFLVNLYRDLKESAGEEQPGGRGLMWIMAWLGMILPILGVVGALVTALPQRRGQLDQYRAGQHVRTAPVHSGTVQRSVPAQNSQGAEQTKTTPGAERGGNGYWRDPAGDTPALGVGHWLDLVGVRLDSGGGMLRIELQDATPFQAAFNAASTTAQPLYRIAVLFFDTDENRATGGVAGADQARPGYDYGIDLTFEVARNQPKKAVVHASLFRLENGARHFLGPLPEDSVQVQYDRLIVRVPYQRMGLRPGQRIRASYVESFQQDGSGLARDTLIRLQ